MILLLQVMAVYTCIAIYTVHLEFINRVVVQRVISLDLGELGILIGMS